MSSQKANIVFGIEFVRAITAGLATPVHLSFQPYRIPFCNMSQSLPVFFCWFILFYFENYLCEKSELKRETYFPSSGTMWVHFPHGHNSQCWAKLKPGANSSIQISHMAAVAKHLDYLPLFFPALAGNWTSSRAAQNQCL